MTTLALSSMRDRLRTLLNDPNSKIWQLNADLDLFLNMAIIKFTTDLPTQSYETYTIATDQQADEHTYLMPDDFVRDGTVRGYFQNGSELENIPRRNIQFGAWDTNDEPRCYMIDWPAEGYLYLPRAPQGTTFTLYYGAYHDTWLEDNTDEVDLGRNRWGEQAIYAYAAYLAFNPASARRAQLEQWARKGDQKVGNPLEKEADRWLQVYQDLLNEHGEVPATWEFSRIGRY